MLRSPQCLLFACLILGSCASPGYEALLVNFDDLTPGAVPAGWSVAETAGKGKPGIWRVEKDAEGRFVQLAETENSGRTYNILFAPDEHPANVAVCVRLRADSGEEDQGGGVVWRAEDADNYYVARWNPLEDNLRAYTVIDGIRKQFASVDLSLKPGWHSLEVSMRGEQLTISMDGKRLIDTTNTTLSAGGLAGLWTKADAATSFDELRIVYLDQ